MPLYISVLSVKARALWILAIVVSAFLLGALLKANSDAALPYLDSLCTSASLVGTYWQAKKRLDNWPLWILINLTYIGMYIYKSLYITALLYCLYTILATIGWIKWTKNYTK